MTYHRPRIVWAALQPIWRYSGWRNSGPTTGDFTGDHNISKSSHAFASMAIRTRTATHLRTPARKREPGRIRGSHTKTDRDSLSRLSGRNTRLESSVAFGLTEVSKETPRRRTWRMLIPGYLDAMLSMKRLDSTCQRIQSFSVRRLLLTTSRFHRCERPRARQPVNMGVKTGASDRALAITPWSKPWSKPRHPPVRGPYANDPSAQ